MQKGVCFGIGIFLALAGCRDDIKVNGKPVKTSRRTVQEVPEPASTATIVDIPDGVSTDRVSYQTRTPIVLSIATDIAGIGDAVSLYNDSTSTTLVSMQPLVLEDSSDRSKATSAMLWNDATASASGNDFTLKLFGLDPVLKDKLIYGENHLRLMAKEDSLSPRRTEWKLMRRDFPLASLSRSYFPSGVQRLEGLEAELSPWHQPLVAAGGRTLVLGVIPMLSR